MLDFKDSRYWKEIINTMNDGLMIIGADGTIEMVNRAFEEMTGFPSEEVVGRPCTLLNCDACETALQESGAWCSLFDRGKDLQKRCMLMRKDGTYLPAIKNAAILRSLDGRTVGAVETLTDVSLVSRLDHELDRLSMQLEAEGGFHGIVGESEVMRRVFLLLEKAAESDAPVILYGESGTGKELAARAIHTLGTRRDGPFVQLNCAALNESLLESELFGHTRGAFTGAYRHRMGRFEASHQGDIFLDEIGDLPGSIQVKLLRVLETKQFERVGDHRPISVDVRIITATNKNLEELIARKQFREDLFFRINVIPIRLPPLRDRLEDIPLLANAFIRRLRTSTGKEITGLTPEVMDRFMRYDWPGNVREFKSALEYAFVIGDIGLIDLDHLPPKLQPLPRGY
ncbi:MAG: sigma 54-interacting transcriptional regulator, partial [Deltaproteobacteria bacterium]|nr:sigma 54-interacting transcriptional regulator [Deltaproteobacteria bacterium]